MAATTNVTNALRYTYGVDRVLYLFNQECPTFNILGRVKKPVGGRGQFIMPILTKNPGAFTGITEGGALPSALQPATTEATFSLQEYVGLYDVSWKLIQDARTNKFAFQQAIQMLDDGLRRRIMRNLNSDLISDGRGALAFLPAADNASPITVSALPRVEVGMVCDIMDDTDDDTKLADSVTVTGVDVQGRTITTSGNPAGTAAGDYFVIQDTTDVSLNSGVALHTNGLIGVIDSANPKSVVGNYGAINRSTAGNEFWQSFVLSNSGTNRALTEDLLLQALDGAREKGGGQIDAWMSNLAIVRRYHEILAGERYFALSKPGTLSGGIGRSQSGMDNGANSSGEGKTPYQFSGVDWYADPFFDPNVVVGLDTSHFFVGVGENEVPRPISEVFEDVPFFRQTSNATFEVAWYYQCELLSDNPAAGVKIKDVAES
jgi:hypothetical protein